jgi:hypothetical protein
MNKTELIEAIRTLQAELDIKVNAASTLKSKTVAQLAELHEQLEVESNTAEAEAMAASQAAAAAEAPKADRPMNRKQCNARLAELGYTGPTSYLMPVLRDIVVYVETMGDMDDALGEAQGRLPEAVTVAIHGSGEQDESNVVELKAKSA